MKPSVISRPLRLAPCSATTNPIRCLNNTTIVWNRSAATTQNITGAVMNFSGAFKDRIINAFDGVTVYKTNFTTVSFNETGLNLNASESAYTLDWDQKQFKALQDLDERIGARNSSVCKQLGQYHSQYSYAFDVDDNASSGHPSASILGAELLFGLSNAGDNTLTCINSTGSSYPEPLLLAGREASRATPALPALTPVISRYTMLLEQSLAVQAAEAFRLQASCPYLLTGLG